MRVELSVEIKAMVHVHGRGQVLRPLPAGTRGHAEMVYADGALLLFVSDLGARAIVPADKLRELEAG